MTLPLAVRYAVGRWMSERCQNPFCNRPSENTSTGPDPVNWAYEPSTPTPPRYLTLMTTTLVGASRTPVAVTSGAPKIDRSQSCVLPSHWYETANPDRKFTVKEPTGAPTGGAFWAT